MGALWLGPGPKNCLLPLPAAKDAGTTRFPGLLGSSRQLKHPSTLRMVIEALEAQDKKEGVSVAAIKQFILAKYPTVDPIRLKYLLKQALSKGLSSGVLMRPHKSTAVGATGSFKLAPKKQQHKKQQLGQVDTNGNEGQAPKLRRKGTNKLPRVPKAGVRQQGAAEDRPVATKEKQKLKVPPVTAQPPAAAKTRRDKAKLPQAAGHPKAPGKGRSGPPEALDDENAGGGDGKNPAGAQAKRLRKVPVGNSKGKVPKGAQQGVPKAKKGQGKARKPEAGAGAGQGEAKLRKAAPSAVGRKAP
ncbi:histone H1.8 [Cuculus canorus]|uniref:histone H1.8 n=1 Tax=Cuculus canorus TaxID=55661 RepID=UPI0023AA872F|nr:histone H1.8 [Cuculus canorus]